MKMFDKFTKVIAISDAPIIESTQFGNNVRAYKKGDIFEVMSSFTDQIVVWHPLIQSSMSLNSDNFEELITHRTKKIESIL